MSKIRIGQIGTAHPHAAGKLASYRASDEFEVVGVVEPDDERRRRVQRTDTYRDVPWLTQEQLLNTPGLQAVAVETDVPDLLTAAEAAVAAGMHIHLDKPPGDALPRLRALFDQAQRRHLVVQMGYMYRYNPGVRLMSEFVRKGWLGEPFELVAIMSRVISPEARAEVGRYPGGIMFELGCHVIDLAVDLLGAPAKVTPFIQASGAGGDMLNDNMLAVLEYPRALATIKSAAIEVEGQHRRQLTLCGAEGTFHIQPLDNPTARVALATPRTGYRRGYQDVELPRYTRYVDDAADLARMVRGEKENNFTPAHDLATHECLLRACGMPVE